MKYLKIDNNKGFYRLDITNVNWLELDQINKDNLFDLLKLASFREFEMDDYNEDLLQNPAHNIIYKNLHGKFTDFLTNKTRFKDSTEAMYKTAIDKYNLQQQE